MDLRKRFGEMKSRLIALNVHDAVMRLTEGSCDLLVAYHHASQPLQLSPDRYEMLSLGQETLAPYAKGGADGQPLFRLSTTGSARIPFLGYASGAYMARLVDQILKSTPVLPHLDTVYETDMAEGLKAMALGGPRHRVPAFQLRQEGAARAPARVGRAAARRRRPRVRGDDGGAHLPRAARAGAPPEAGRAGAVGLPEARLMTASGRLAAPRALVACWIPRLRASI